MKVMERLQGLLAEYGKVALATYFSIFALVWLGFGVAIALGFRTEGAAATAGVLGASYLATKITQPLRIAATVLLTPLIARLVRRPSARPELGPKPEAEPPVRGE
jgi:hypothetical protein